MKRSTLGGVIEHQGKPVGRAAAILAARSKVAERLAEVNEEIARCEAPKRALSERFGARQMTLDSFDAANEPWRLISPG